MNFQQLEYIVAVHQTRHFARAAERCFVTQPTLSMMIQKLEDELGGEIFDRSKQPVALTSLGERIIEQAQIILNHKSILVEMVKSEIQGLEGELKLGIIPTLAPYLLPRFIDDFLEKYPQIHLNVEEDTTDNIIEKLKMGDLDLGIMATPLSLKNIIEVPIFYERFFLYGEQQTEKSYMLAEEIDVNRLILLEEGHCLRSQVINLCEIKEKDGSNVKFKFGSLETLKRLVEKNQGITILPELMVKELPANQRSRVLPFQQPEPVREVSIVKHRSFVKHKVLECLQTSICKNLPAGLVDKNKSSIVSI